VAKNVLQSWEYFLWTSPLYGSKRHNTFQRLTDSIFRLKERVPTVQHPLDKTSDKVWFHIMGPT